MYTLPFFSASRDTQALMCYTTYHFGIPMFCAAFGIVCDSIIPDGVEKFPWFSLAK